MARPLSSSPAYVNTVKVTDEAWIAQRATKSRATWYLLSPASQQPGHARTVLGSLAPATYVLAEQQGQKSSPSTQAKNFVHLQPQSPLWVL